ncbi:MAG: N-acetylmuramoyl-L-alanine amidase, partial [Thermoanaerobaculia bacterium]
MKRLFSLSLLAALAAASIVLAQSSGQGVVRTSTGDHPFTWVLQSGQVYVSVDEVAKAVGATVTPESTGYRIAVNNVTAAFGPDSRFGVVRDELIEMPVPPTAIEGRPYVPWQFFRGFLTAAASLDVTLDPATHLMTVKPVQRDVIDVQLSLANVHGISKLVFTLSSPAGYSIVKDPGAYMLRFEAPIRPPFTEQAYDDPNVSKVSFTGNEVRIQLMGSEVVGDAYTLDNPARVVLDLRKGAAAAPGTSAPIPGAGRPAAARGIRTIVIDPGHGGKEVGAIGPAGVMEKDLTLTISRKLADSLAARTGARVVLTREDDSLVPLDARTAIANQYEADLFLSVHMNAAVVKDAKGSETYFLSLDASDEAARAAAETENASAGTSAAADLNLILWDLAQQKYLQESSRFAQTIQEQMNAATGVQNRGVKQAPFKVLIGATMPAALVEVAFISNAEEEAKLQSEEFQKAMVETLTAAVVRYKTDYETRIGLVQPAAPAAPAPATSQPGAPAAKPTFPPPAPAAAVPTP